MDRSSASIRGQYARSVNDCNRPGGHAASSRRGRYRHATVRQWDDIPRTNPGVIHLTVLLTPALLNIYSAVR